MCWWCWFFGDKLSENGFNRIMNETRNEYERMEFIFADAFGVKSWFQLIWQSEWKCVDAASKWINLDFSSRGNSRSCLFDMWIAYTPHKRMNWCVCWFFFSLAFLLFFQKEMRAKPISTNTHTRARESTQHIHRDTCFARDNNGMAFRFSATTATATPYQVYYAILFFFRS